VSDFALKYIKIKTLSCSSMEWSFSKVGQLDSS